MKADSKNCVLNILVLDVFSDTTESIPRVFYFGDFVLKSFCRYIRHDIGISSVPIELVGYQLMNHTFKFDSVCIIITRFKRVKRLFGQKYFARKRLPRTYTRTDLCNGVKTYYYNIISQLRYCSLYRSLPLIRKKTFRHSV